MSETETSPDEAGTPDRVAAEESNAPGVARPPGEPDSRAVHPAPTATAFDDGTSDAAQLPDGSPPSTPLGRVRKWDRPPPPHDWRWYVGTLGKVMIAVGLLMFGFVGYQLYGTGIEMAAAQNALEDDFEELLAQTTPISAPAVESNDSPTVPATTGAEPGPNETETEPAEVATIDPPPGSAVPVEEQNLPNLDNGEALARIEIPRIGVDDIVVAGVDTGDLKKGPGHYPDTPLPGQLGNSAIAGHRTTYGQPFRNVDQLRAGDEIRVTTLSGVYVYRVTGQQIVSPSDYQVVATTDPTRATLTLTSCHPVFTARERIVISSELAATESAPVGAPVLNYGRAPDMDEPRTDESTSSDVADDPTIAAAPPDETPTTDVTTDSAGAAGAPTEDPQNASDRLGTDAVNEGIADAFSDGWFSDPGATAQVGWWGLVLSAVALGAYLVSRRFRRDWVGLLVGIVPFVVASYFFFQNVNRLLPPNL